MPDLQLSDFRQFFFELHEKIPFPWQEALAERVCANGWPDVIDLPTASGKTACMDIALFALALCGAEMPRRIFFVVDRRVVVNEAYLRMKGVCGKLRKATAGVLKEIADRLSLLGGKDQPLSVYEMRGGALRDETWVKNPLQPTVVTSTVDQVGSRLLFRGYGVSENSWSLHAGLIGNDALIILDEAHCSRAFAQTLQRIDRYRGESWAVEPVRRPFRFVEMTATPSRERGERFRISENDRRNEAFQKRLHASKPVRLVEVKGKKDDFGKLAEALIEQAVALAKEGDAKRVAVIVNRVQTAKIVAERLKKRGLDAELVIGRMRAIDRDDLYRERLAKLRSDAPRSTGDTRAFVVSTQCLEVGADLDFDVLLSECASIDALLQRFGRLDRLGNFGRARGAVVIGSWQVNPKQPDAVYGEALAQTWQWLKTVAGESNEVNMGIEAADGALSTVSELLPTDSSRMRLYGEDAPVLLPAHLDTLVQTSPAPVPEPMIELFLHGPNHGIPDVQVVWRADLNKEKTEDWTEIVALCPPSSRETMPVRIDVFKRWFAGEKQAQNLDSDLPVGVENDEPKQQGSISALVWRGEDSKPTRSVKDIKPGQTIVLPVSAGGWNDLGYIPDYASKDVGDRAAFEARKSVSLRLHPEVMEEWRPQTEALEAVKQYAKRSDAERSEMEARLIAYLKDLEAPSWPYPFLSQFKELSRTEFTAYPEQNPGYALLARRTTASQQSNRRISLKEHLDDVVEKINPDAASDWTEALKLAARLHDYGKADVRYQAWLLGGDTMAARYAPNPIAKSGVSLLRRQESVGLPKGFRHELLSLMFAEKSPDLTGEARDLVLHLVATHHGRCRPLAPVVLDEDAECVSYGGISICREERAERAPHRLDSGIAERFWKLTRKHGWWGLAYLEALLRLADWKASEKENAEVSE